MKILLCLLCLFFSTHSFSEPFQPGHYYAKDGRKMLGLIKFYRAGYSVFGTQPSSIQFKSSSKDRPITLTAEGIDAFVIVQDSFTVATNFEINATWGSYKKDFVKVLKVGPLCLYQHFSSGSMNGKYWYSTDCYVIAEAGKSIFLGLWNLGKQKEDIAQYLRGKGKVYDKFLNRKMMYAEIPALIDAFNAHASSFSDEVKTDGF